MSDYELRFPAYFEDAEAEITAKGYFADLTIVASGRTFRPILYDPVRLLQDVQDEVALAGVFVVRSIVVVESVTRSLIERAVDALARVEFTMIAPEDLNDD